MLAKLCRLELKATTTAFLAAVDGNRRQRSDLIQRGSEPRQVIAHEKPQRIEAHAAAVSSASSARSSSRRNAFARVGMLGWDLRQSSKRSNSGPLNRS